MTSGWLKNIASIFTSSAARAPTWEEDRARFFKSLRKDDVATIRQIAAKYPKEAVAWESEKGSALRVAQEKGNLKAFTALLELGADPSQTYKMKRRNGSWESSPLHRAIETRRLDFAAVLVERGADLEKRDYRYESDIVASSSEHSTPLAAAIRNKDQAAVTFLLERGADAKGFCYRFDWDFSSGSVSTPAAYAATIKGASTVLDLVKRADILRAAYLTQNPTLATPAKPAASPAPAVQEAAAPAKPAAPKQPAPRKSELRL